MIPASVISSASKFLETEPKEQVKQMLRKSIVKALVGLIFILFIIYLSRYLLNGAAVTIHAYKNLQQALER